jgi:hypothetical protein
MLYIIHYETLEYFKGHNKVNIAQSLNINYKLALPEVQLRTKWTKKQSKQHGYIDYVIPVLPMAVHIQKHGKKSDERTNIT